MNKIVKPQYIRKYDFIRYFTRNKDEWFWKEVDLENYVKNKIDALNNNSVDDEEDEDEFDESKYDSFSLLKEKKETNEDMDLTDPKIFEGNLIDKECRKYIIDAYKDCKVFDFDEYKFNNQSAFKKTLDIIKNNDNVLLFQPTFIYKDIAIAKPDALVRLHGEYILIETKGTTNTKLSHLVDVQYQVNIVDDVLDKFNTCIDQCKLCIVRYEKLNKGRISFLLTEYCNYQKSGAPSTKKYESEYNDKFSNEYIKLKQSYKDGSICGNNIIDYVHGKIAKFKRYEDLGGKNFDKIINELKNAELFDKPSLKPCREYKGWFKDANHWNLLREYYFLNSEYIPFSYSGFLIKYQQALQYLDSHFKTDAEFLKNASTDNPSKVFDRFYSCFNKTDSNRTCKNDFSYSSLTINKFKTLKNKKVYFDFESLNTSVRVVDNSLPFMQAVNQVSVIFDNGDGRLVKKDNSIGCDNVIIDPLNMNINDYKTIIDAIYPNNDQQNYSYIVYNKNFEVTRLNEMKKLLKDSEYSLKVDTITKNIFDLADFFDLRKDEYICINELHAYFSIKKVLPIIQKYTPDIFVKTGCKDYGKLEIHNGGQAQTESTKRFFNLLNNDEWNTTANNLKTYCENDVRAMIAVEYFIKNLII